MPGYTGQRRVIPPGCDAGRPDHGRLARCSENRAPYRERLVWGVAPGAVRTDDMGVTLYAMTVCARAVRQRRAVLRAAIGRTVRATAQTARRFPCPVGKARERRHSHVQRDPSGRPPPSLECGISFSPRTGVRTNGDKAAPMAAAISKNAERPN